MKFTRHAYHRKKRISPAWRRPKGLHNKLRLQKKGHKRLVKTGYGTPSSAHGTVKGLVVVRVQTLADLAGLDPKKHAVILARVGDRKRLSLLEAIDKQKLTLVTGDPKDRIKRITEEFSSRKQDSKKREEEKESKQKAAKKEAEKKEKEAEKLEDKVDEETKADERTKEEKEKEKVLTKAR